MKDFLETCLAQFEVYIWSAAQCHNINGYLETKNEETQIKIDLSKNFDQQNCTQNDHFLLTKLEKHVFHKNLDAFFVKYPSTHLGNTLLVNDTTKICLTNGLMPFL